MAASRPAGHRRLRMQMNYVGDMRVVFDAFFPGILPPTAIEIPESLMLGWETVYAPAVALGAQQECRGHSATVDVGRLRLTRVIPPPSSRLCSASCGTTCTAPTTPT